MENFTNHSLPRRSKSQTSQWSGPLVLLLVNIFMPSCRRPGGAAMKLTEQIAAAVRLLAGGCWRQVEDAARAILAARPDDMQAALLMGLAIAAMGEADRAAPVMVRVAA